VAEAADILGITVEAVRGRIKRNTIAHERTDEGVFVFVGADWTANRSRPDTDQSTDQTLLIARLENEIQFLREELARKDAIMLNMTEAMKAISPPSQEEESQEEPYVGPREYAVTPTPQPGRVEPQTPLEGSQQPVESPELAEDEQQGRGPVPDAGGPQEGAQRPWWRKLLGG
jgi:hypothetical protein